MSDEVLQLESLLAPIGEDTPSGADIREDTTPSSIYYQIKDARTSARANERRILMEDDRDAMGRMVPEWSKVLELAPRILRDHTKDLEIAAWYVEALVRAHGFLGLTEGFKLLRELVEQYWDNLYPLPDEDGIETRVAPITGLNGDDAEGTLIGPIFQVKLTQGYTDQPYAAWHYQQAAEVDRILDEDKREARLKSGAVSMAQIERSALETPFSFYEELLADLQNSQEEYTKLCAALDARAGEYAPPSSNIRNALAKVREIVGFITKDMFSEEHVEAEPATAEAANTDAGAADKKARNSTIPDVIATRDDAVRALHKVAEYFKKAEPHSPVSYSLEQAIKWSRMSLPELLMQLIPDERAREEYSRLTGIQQTEN